MTKIILILESDRKSYASLANILSDNGFQITSFDSAKLSSEETKIFQESVEMIAAYLREIAVKELLLHYLTNLTGSILAPLSTLNDLVQSNGSGVNNELKELIPLTKEAAEQLHKSLLVIPSIETAGGAETCTLLDAIRQSEKAYKAALLDSGILLTFNVAEDSEVNVPIYIVSLAISNIIDNAKDAILEAKGKAGREIRIESYEENGVIICHIANSGAIDDKHVPYIFRKKYTTKGPGRGMGLPLILKCLEPYGAELTLTATGPPETIFSFKFRKSLTLSPPKENLSVVTLK